MTNTRFSRASLFLCAIVPLCLSACVNGVGLLDAKDNFFEEVEKDGPQIEGVETTLFKSAQRSDEVGRYEKSIQLYAQLIEMDKTNHLYIVKLADSLRHSGDLDRAEVLYEQLIDAETSKTKAEPEQEEPKKLLGNAFGQAEEPEEEVTYLMDAKEGLALVKLMKGEFDRAGVLLSEIHAEDPKRWRTLNALAILLVERDALEDALKYFQEALKHKPRHPSILNNMGLTYAINDQPKEAVKRMVQASDSAPAGSVIKKNVELNLALVMGIFGDMQAAEAILKNHLSDAAVANNLGLYAYLSDNEALAKGYLNNALSSTSFHYERAWANLKAVSEQSAAETATKVKRNGKQKIVKVPK